MLAPIAPAAANAKNPPMRRLRITASAVALTTTALAVLAAVQLAGDAAHRWVTPFLVLSVLSPAAVGLLIGLRQPKNVVAWVLLLGALSTAPSNALSTSHAAWTLQVSRATWPLLYAWPIAVAYVFPDGRLLGRRWRWAATVRRLLRDLHGARPVRSVAVRPAGRLRPQPALHNRLRRDPLNGTGIWVPFWIGILASLFAGALAIRLRLKRATGVQRLQTLWLAWAAALIPLGLVSARARVLP